ncbi:hypothetical protein TRFO_41748 [Tritrichomonas foetus]|uniref:Uncharacterized protein n=1 Tax=Tritrichomonas foetus TaxID=1144522 RepID=A0A1J4KZ32_9EUKA|nr:hypothetical protein TRFO_41748 [Tritrichomonas foetus]|eukprot:OHT16515.1 hypothetical protein TRFO_41748 [Tritrichomonas foetus]
MIFGKTECELVISKKFINFQEVPFPLPTITNYRKYNTILPVYINKMKHSKGIFSTNSSTESSIRIDYPELVMIPVDKHGNVSSYNMNHLWGCIMKMTMQTMVTRILILNISITNSKNVDFSVKTFRHYLRLVAIYNSLTFYDLQEEETEKALSLIDQNPSLFTDFFYDWELNKAINVFQFSEYYETYIMKGIPSEFGLRYMFGMWQIKSCSQTHDIINYIHYAYDLYKKLVNKINKKNPKEYVWILQFLHDISIICSKENNKHIEFTHVLNDYITELNLLIKLNENDRIYDFSSIENSENFEIIVTINDVHQIIQEKNNMLRCIYENYIGLGLKRHALLLITQYLDELLPYVDLSDLFSVLTHEFCKCLSIIPFKHFDKYTIDGKIKIACQLLCNMPDSLEFQHLGCQLMDNIFGSNDHCSFRPTHLSIPVYVKCIETNKDTYVVNKMIEMEFEVFCRFDGSFNISQLQVGLIDKWYRMTYFHAENVKIANKSRFCAKGICRYVLPLSPRCLIFSNDFTTTFPTILQVIHVNQAPPPFNFENKIPSLLLPGLWQMASIAFYVVNPLSTLSLKITGLNHQSEEMILSTGEKIKPSDGLSFYDVPIGEHQLNMSIYTNKSGNINVTAISNDKNDDNNRYLKKTTKYHVSEYLDINISYRKETNAVQLIVFTNDTSFQSDITLINVDFYNSENDDKIECQAFGLPVKIIRTQTSLFFILKSCPETAYLFLSQGDLEPFYLRLNVTLHDDSNVDHSEPLTLITSNPIIPINLNL